MKKTKTEFGTLIKKVNRDLRDARDTNDEDIRAELLEAVEIRVNRFRNDYSYD